MRLGDAWLSSKEGTQQGDPASFLMFTLAIHFIFRSIEAECELFVHRWYPNDGMLVGKIEQVKQALVIITEREL